MKPTSWPVPTAAPWFRVFHLRVSAVALKLIHNWGVHVLGGTLVTTAALAACRSSPQRPVRSAKQNWFFKTRIWKPWFPTTTGSLPLVVRGGGFTPGFSYNKADLVNIGQHNYATAPSGRVFLHASSWGQRR